MLAGTSPSRSTPASPPARSDGGRQSKIFPSSKWLVASDPEGGGGRRRERVVDDATCGSVFQPELQRWEEEQCVIDWLASPALPKEIVLEIQCALVSQRYAQVYLADEQTLGLLTTALLGQSASAVRLRPLAQQALFETAVVRVDVRFELPPPTPGAEGVVQAWIPAFVADAPHRIRHLLHHSGVDIRRGRLTYPIALLRLTRAMPSLTSHFPNLHTFSLGLDLDINEDYDVQILDRTCLCGYSARTTFREVIARLIDAVRLHGPGRRKDVQMRWRDHADEVYLGSKVILPSPATTAEEGRSSNELVAEASRATWSSATNPRQSGPRRR
ncbi:hypothetical protein LTR37_009928 [Vermiconidia calcicola]|uniref:Uncharacterized protein n=1 Tax=Vermiconidia calcicola TaxID=1690605 RepID=A0ACC3N6K9_9PEZI|nr:hypothetical protein LTR37_009928 [Vermiconidia calcicola]